MLMRYHVGLGVGHLYALQASGGSRQQSADTSQIISMEEYKDQDEEHGGYSISIPQCSELSPSSESAEEDSDDGSSKEGQGFYQDVGCSEHSDTSGHHSFFHSSPCPTENSGKKVRYLGFLCLQSVLANVAGTESIMMSKKRSSSTRSSKENTPWGPQSAKRPHIRTKHHLPPPEPDISIMVSNLMQQEFRRRANFEEKMLQLNLQVLEEIQAMRREVTSFTREYHRCQSLAL
jgi:hypothetical protein